MIWKAIYWAPDNQVYHAQGSTWYEAESKIVVQLDMRSLRTVQITLTRPNLFVPNNLHDNLDFRLFLCERGISDTTELVRDTTNLNLKEIHLHNLAVLWQQYKDAMDTNSFSNILKRTKFK